MVGYREIFNTGMVCFRVMAKKMTQNSVPF